MFDDDEEEEFRQKVGEVVGDRLMNALRHTFIADIGLDHLPVSHIEGWMRQFSGIEDYNGLSFLHSQLIRNGRSRFTITGVGTVENAIVHKWLDQKGLGSTFTFEIESHGRKDELGNLPQGVWPEYAPYGMTFRPAG